MPSADEWIDAVLNRAPELRKAGVSTITLDGCSVSLRPADPAYEEVGEPVVESSGDPLFDPATYPNGRVPGFTMEKKQ